MIYFSKRKEKLLPKYIFSYLRWSLRFYILCMFITYTNLQKEFNKFFRTSEILRFAIIQLQLKLTPIIKMIYNLFWFQSFVYIYGPYIYLYKTEEV